MSETKPDLIYAQKETFLILEYFKNDFFEGWLPNPTKKVKIDCQPGFQWRGKKIPYAIWEQIVGFMKWSQKEHKAEAHLTLFYNTDTQQWAAWALPQEPAGMTVKLLENDPQFAIDRAQFGQGWIMAGSVHHHCESSAFQSQTDSADEKNRDGIHITIGKTSNKEIDIHCRQVMDGLMMEAELEDWFDGPDWIQHVPKQFQDFGKELFSLCKGGEFPEDWKSRVKPRTFTYHQSGYTGGHQQNFSTGSSQPASAASPETKVTSLHRPTLLTNGGTGTMRAGLTATNANANWVEKADQFILEILNTLKLTAGQAKRYYCMTEEEASQLDTQGQVLRSFIIDEFAKSEWPKLFVEGRLEVLIRRSLQHSSAVA